MCCSTHPWPSRQGGMSCGILVLMWQSPAFQLHRVNGRLFRSHFPVDGISLIPNAVERDQRRVSRFADSSSLERKRLIGHRLEPCGDILIVGREHWDIGPA